MDNVETTKKPMSSKIATVIAILAIAAAGYFYYELYTLKQDPNAQARKEVNTLVAKVSKLVVLPEGETPTVATVSDVEALKSQPFFANAKQGDKVLIFAQSRKAILYSVEMNKIIEVAPLNIGEAAPATN